MFFRPPALGLNISGHPIIGQVSDIIFRKPAFGLDISDYSIEIISLRGSFENPRLAAMARTVLDPGIVENGKILDQEKLKQALEGLIKNPDFGRIKTRRFIFAIPESRSFIHIFNLPKGLAKTEEAEFIKTKAQQIFPYSLKELHLDFKIKDGEEREVLLVAAPRNIVDDFREVFKNCGLEPRVLGIESESLGRALIQGRKETVLVADIGQRTTNFSLFDRGGLRLSVTFELAGNRFTQAISENLKISSEKAEVLKKEVGLNPGAEEGRVFLALQKEVRAIIGEVAKIEDYFQKKEGRKIENIILAGGSAMLPGLPEYLSEDLQKNVTIGDPWVKINIDILKRKEYFKKALKINPLVYAPVIGSALRALAKDPEGAGINLIKDIGKI